MPKKAAKTQGIPRKATPRDVPIKADSSALIAQTLVRVDRTIKSLEDFLARWDASETKPDNMFPEVVKIRKFYDLLKLWQKEASGAHGKGDEESRVRRLRDFVLLCRMYS